VTDFAGGKEVARKALPEPVILSWMGQTLAGLSHLHGQGVVHRDLKSSNIFLCEQRRRIRIGDFGISRVLESTAFASSCVGTPAYMSPELMRNERYDCHVDMWALGCISYELVTLDLPFMASSLLDLVFQVVETEPDWSKWQTCSEELRAVTQRLLCKDVSVRPTADDILEESLFGEDGRAAMNVPQEVWAVVAPIPEMDEKSISEPHRRTGDSTPSELTTAGTGTGSQGMGALSSDGGTERGSWQSAPRLAWETKHTDESISGGYSLRGSQGGVSSRDDISLSSFGAARGFEEEMQAAREAHVQLSKDEFQNLLTTHHLALRQELQAAAAGLPSAQFPGAAQAAQAEPPPPRILPPAVNQVPESVM
jgi:serine/threonine protein kinase